MKNRVVSLMIALIAFVSLTHAQVSSSSSPHLTFKGVPIDGTLRDYTSKMEKNGFELIGNEDGFSLLQGDFASYKKCFVGVATLKQKDVVSKITVMFPEQETWSTLSTNYFELKKLLTEKYGKPTGVVEKFEGFQPDDDNSRMTSVKLDNCKYYTTYSLDKGTIRLSIERNETRSCYVMIVYSDRINGEIIKKNALSDL